MEGHRYLQCSPESRSNSGRKVLCKTALAVHERADFFTACMPVLSYLFTMNCGVLELRAAVRNGKQQNTVLQNQPILIILKHLLLLKIKKKKKSNLVRLW